MGSGALRELPALWPHLLLLAAVAWTSTRARRWWIALGLAAVWTGVGVLSYWLLDNGIAPPSENPISGRTWATVAAIGLPLLAEAATVRICQWRRLPILPSVAIGVAVGGALVVGLPVLQLALTCLLARICP